MSILIKGMDMPIDGAIGVVIYSDGRVTSQFGVPAIGRAVPVPPHGRLIDADALTKGIEADAIWEDGATDEYTDGIRAGARVMKRSICNAPTVIPAEEKK